LAAPAVALLGLAALLGADGLVELGGERTIVRAARLVLAAIARTPRLGRVVGVAHLGVVRHLGGGRVHRLGGILGHLVGRGLGFLQAHSLQVFGVRRLAVLTFLVLAALVVLALLAFFLVVLAAPLIAHVER